MSHARRLSDDALGCIQPLFAQVFKHPISLDLLRWKYACGRGESWILPSAAQPVALHCGLIFRDVLWHGELVRAAQLVDLIAAPKLAGLSREGSPFRQLMGEILAGLPRADNPEGIAFGFPSGRAMRLGEHLGVYCAVDRWFELHFSPRTVGRLAPRAQVLLSFGEPEVTMTNRLWKTMAHGLQDFCVGRRDADFFRQRYLCHPERRYVVLRIDSAWLRRPVGLAVIRPGETAAEVLDVVGAWEDFPDILGAVQGWLMGRSEQGLSMMLTSHFAHELRSLAERCEDTQFRIMANPRNSAQVLAQLENQWWLTGGDSDYR